jgi:hypothetical protein
MITSDPEFYLNTTKVVLSASEIVDTLTPKDKEATPAKSRTLQALL